MPKTINVSTKKFPSVAAIVDDGMYDELARFTWTARSSGKNIYACRHDGTRLIHMHREVLGLGVTGPRVDHRDGNGLNNQRANLRAASSSQNQANQGKRAGACASRFKGVAYDPARKKWRAQIGVHGVRKNLGYFEVEEDAARRYDVAARMAFGEFARLNFGAAR